MKSLSAALLGLVAVPLPPPVQDGARRSPGAGEAMGNGVGVGAPASGRTGMGPGAMGTGALRPLLLMASLFAAALAALSLIALECYAIGQGTGARMAERIGPGARRDAGQCCPPPYLAP